MQYRKPNQQPTSPSGADRSREVSEKIERMARRKHSDPFEYRSLTPSQRLRYIVKKTEYQSPPMPKTRYFPVPRHLMRSPLFKPIPIPKKHSIERSPQKWKAPSRKQQQRARSKWSFATLPQHMRVQYVLFGTRHTTHNKPREHKRPFPGVKRPRPSPAEGSYCRAAKRFRYTDVEPVRGVKRPRSQPLDNSTEPTAKRRRCVRRAVRRRSLLFADEETVKEEMNGIKWNRRLANARIARIKEQADMVRILTVCRNRTVFER